MLKKLFEKLKTHKYPALFCVAAGAITYYMFLQKFDSIRGFFSGVLAALNPFIWGAAIAYLLNPIAKFFERTVFGKMKKQTVAHTLSVLLTLLASLAAIAILGVAIVPQIASSFVMLFNNLEGYFNALKKTLNTLAASIPFLDPEVLDIDRLIGSWEQIFMGISDWVVKNISGIIGGAYKLGSSVFNLVIAAIFSVYVLLDKKDLKRLARRISAALLPEEPLRRFGDIVRKSNRIFLVYIGGSLLDSLIVLVANYIFMLIMGMPYSLLISAIVAITNLIPNFGPFIGAVPSALILLLVNPWDALWFIIFTCILQFLDGNVVKPLLFSDSTGLRPVWVLVSIIIGGHIMGIVGMLIGVPVFAIIFFLLDEALAARLPKRGYDLDGHKLKPETEADSPSESAANEPADAESAGQDSGAQDEQRNTHQ